jgi:hypothetical protein
MSATLIEIQEQAKQMEAHDRARLAYVMLESLEANDEGDIEQAWEKEIAARWVELERGEVAPVPASEVFASLRHKLRKNLAK